MIAAHAVPFFIFVVVAVAVGFSNVAEYCEQCLKSIGCICGDPWWECTVPYVPKQVDACLSNQDFSATISLKITPKNIDELPEDAIKFPSTIEIASLQIGYQNLDNLQLKAMSKNALRFV